MSAALPNPPASSEPWLRVPGKAMLIGEYAVLDGGEAVVAAIDSYALASPKRLDGPLSPFVQAAQREATLALTQLGRSLPTDRPAQVEIDTSAFSQRGQKLGLGSSAAVTVATVGGCFALAGLSLEASAVRALIAKTAQRAHDSAQGVRGSGADILASTWGGLRRLGGLASQLGDEPPCLELPAGLVLRLVGTSHSASTAQLVSRYRAASSAVAPARAQLAAAATEFILACQSDDARRVLAAVSQAAQGYRQLGEILGFPLLTDEHAAVAKLAARLGGAAKPSGAGGGDLAVAFLPGEDAAQRLADELPPELWILPLRISKSGIQLIAESSASDRAATPARPQVAAD